MGGRCVVSEVGGRGDSCSRRLRRSRAVHVPRMSFDARVWRSSRHGHGHRSRIHMVQSRFGRTHNRKLSLLAMQTVMSPTRAVWRRGEISTARRHRLAHLRWKHEAYGELGRSIHDLTYEILSCSESPVVCKKVSSAPSRHARDSFEGTSCHTCCTQTADVHICSRCRGTAPISDRTMPPW